MTFKNYPQTAKPWELHHVGQSAETMGAEGCIVCSAATIASYAMGKDVDPDAINAEFIRAGAFVGKTAFLRGVQYMFDGAFDGRIKHVDQSAWYRNEVPANDLEGLRNFLRADESHFAILCLSLPYGAGRNWHYVCAWGVNKAGEILCMDPAFGTRGSLGEVAGTYYGEAKRADTYGKTDAIRIYRWDTFIASKAATPPAPVVPPTPTPSGAKFRLGVNALSNTREAMIEAQHGCRHFLIMDSFIGASQIKKAYPDASVMVRRYWTYRPNVDQAMAGLEGANDPGLIYTGTNEADVMGQGGQGLIDRARFDIAVAERVRAKGGTYAAGTFSVGTPDFTNPKECDIIRALYAPAYNSGLIAFDMHLYSPNMAHVSKPQEHIWFERRWEFLFTQCGFNPRVRAIYCSETGVDEGNVGGFKAHGLSQEAFADWCAKYTALQNAPLVVNGVSYPSPILGGAIFQLGGNGDQRWAGYDITDYLPTLRKFY